VLDPARAQVVEGKKGPQRWDVNLFRLEPFLGVKRGGVCSDCQGEKQPVNGQVVVDYDTV